MNRDGAGPAFSDEEGEDRKVLAGFLIRFLARMLDAIVLVAIINLIYYLDGIGGARGWWPPMPVPGEIVKNIGFQENAANIARLLFYTGIHPLYYIIMHGLGGQTLGKIAFKIMVVDENGDEISMGRSALRWFGYVVCDITLGIGYLMVAFSEKRQGLHDKMANTFVIYT